MGEQKSTSAVSMDTNPEGYLCPVRRTAPLETRESLSVVGFLCESRVINKFSQKRNSAMSMDTNPEGYLCPVRRTAPLDTRESLSVLGFLCESATTYKNG